jgi:hypothetical protein
MASTLFVVVAVRSDSYSSPCTYRESGGGEREREREKDTEIRAHARVHTHTHNRFDAEFTLKNN